ncbi:MAG: hypothetical protein H6728_04930 [Myxococcales bacterium]|nr:hypothetical protein [Myxococcales bacterium]MCB9642397.1 hypothetical protein [Myxococcales bacterium]
MFQHPHVRALVHPFSQRRTLQNVFSSLAGSWPLRIVRLLFVCALLCSLAPTAQADDTRAHQVVISGVYYHGFLRGRPEPEEAIRLTNVSKRTVDVSSWMISDMYTKRSARRRRNSSRRPRGRWGRNKRQESYQPTGKKRRIVLPPGTRLRPGQSIWIAYQADGFRRMFGISPDIQGDSDAPNIPKADLPEGWPNLPSTRGVVSLHDPNGRPVDIVCYDTVKDTQNKPFDASAIPQGHWSGPPVNMRGANPYASRGQVLARDRNEKGIPVPDTNTAADWNNSFSATKLGADVTHRVEKPGQSLFTPQRHKNTSVDILVTSAPENNYASLIQRFKSARKQILLNVYLFTNPELANTMIQAKRRGVDVRILFEGVPVGGVPKKARYYANKMHKAGIPILWMRGNRKQKIIRRYRFNHAKYAIIDQTWVIIGTENYGTTGHPPRPDFGNRGWEIQIRSPVLVRDLYAVWKHDTDTAHQLDLLPIADAGGTRWGPPPSSFNPKERSYTPIYRYRRPALRVSGRADLEMVLSPDNSLHERQSLMGSILSCQNEVLIQQNSIPLFWGKKHKRSFLKTPNLPLMAVIQAARKGCRVRVLLDSTWYNIDVRDDRKNDKTVAMLNRIAAQEKLNLRARLINLQAAGVAKIHAKGVIVDRKEVFVGSINWTENSFKGNREVGVIVRHPKVAAYYTDLFIRDWLQSRIFQIVLRNPSPVYKQPSIRAEVLARLQPADTLDVLAELPSFYQVRIGQRQLGYVLKGDHEIYMTPYEARFQVGRSGVVVGRIVSVKERRKMFQIFFAKPVERQLLIVLWKTSAAAFQQKFANQSPAKALVGKYVQIQGMITQYRGSAQLNLKAPGQIRFLQ